MQAQLSILPEKEIVVELLTDRTEIHKSASLTSLRFLKFERFYCLPVLQDLINFVLSRDALLHDLQEVVIYISAVDQQRFLQTHSQMQLMLKDLHADTQKQEITLPHDRILFSSHTQINPD